MDVHAACQSGSNSTSQPNTATHAGNIIPLENTDPFQVVDGGIESWASDSFVLVGDDDETLSTVSLGDQGCEDNANEESGEGCKAELKKAKQTDDEKSQADEDFGGLTQKLKTLRTEVAGRHNRGRHVVKRLAEVAEKLRTTEAELGLTSQEKAVLPSYIETMTYEECVPLEAGYQKQAAGGGYSEAASDAMETGCGREELNSVRQELQDTTAEAELLQEIWRESNTRTVMLNDQLEAAYSGLLASAKEGLEWADEMRRVRLSGQPHFEEGHDQ